MFEYFICGVILVLLIILIYWAFIHCDDTRTRRRARKLIQKSAGGFDQNAQNALGELARIAQPTAADRFDRGNVIRYNLLEGNLDQVQNETRGDRMNRYAAIGNIARDYAHALTELTTPVTVDNPAFMLFRIDDFQRDLLAIDDTDDIIMQIIGTFGDVYNQNAQVARQNIVNNRVETARTADTRGEAIGAFFDGSVQYTNDPQNVHDTGVNKDLNDTLSRLRTTPSAKLSTDDIRNYMQNEYYARNDAAKVMRAMECLNKMAAGDAISTFNTTEDRILASVWARCDHPQNAKNAANMRDAVIDSLADSVENGALVCPNGRCARILGSLATLDFDRNVGSVMTAEAYKNQIFQETKTIIEDEIKRAKASDDTLLRAVGESFDRGVADELDVDAAVLEQFRAEIKAEIDRNLSSYTEKLAMNELENIRNECYVYATI